MIMRSPTAVAVTTALVALLVGCGDAPSRPSSAPSGPQPVTLVTYSAFVLSDDVKADLERRSGLAITLVLVASFVVEAHAWSCSGGNATTRSFPICMPTVQTLMVRSGTNAIGVQCFICTSISA